MRTNNPILFPPIPSSALALSRFCFCCSIAPPNKSKLLPKAPNPTALAPLDNAASPAVAASVPLFNLLNPKYKLAAPSLRSFKPLLNPAVEGDACCVAALLPLFLVTASANLSISLSSNIIFFLEICVYKYYIKYLSGDKHGT